VDLTFNGPGLQVLLPVRPYSSTAGTWNLPAGIIGFLGRKTLTQRQVKFLIRLMTACVRIEVP